MLTAELTRKVTTGASLSYNVFPISVASEEGTAVTCSLSGQDVNANITSEGTVVDVSAANVTCIKSGDGFAAITIPTSESDFNIVMPSASVAEQTELENVRAELIARLAEVSSEIERVAASSDETSNSILAELSSRASTLENSIATTRSFVSGQKWTVVSKGYSCTAAANNQLIGCPAGYVNTGAIWYNTWPGGPCGQGSVFNMCVQQ